MNAQQNTSCCQYGCQLCEKEEEVNQLQSKRKRDISHKSIYRKDYKNNLFDLANQIQLPKGSKNQSSNFQYQRKQYLDINSTYISNFHQKSQQKPKHAHSSQTILNPEKLSENFVSTYNSNYKEHPIDQRQAYKIAEFQLYNMKNIIPKSTQYIKQYTKVHKNVPQKIEIKDQIVDGPLRVFDTTHKNHYRGQYMRDKGNKPILPQHNMGTLPTSGFLYNSTYKNEFNDDPSRNTQNKSHFRNFHSLKKKHLEAKNFYF